MLTRRLRRLRGRSDSLPTLVRSRTTANDVDEYWTGHTVNSRPFSSARASRRYLQWRLDHHPGLAQLMNLYEPRENQVILDYGCGPGNDVTGFLLYANPAKVIGIDVSETSLGLTRDRVALHGIDPARVELVQSSDTTTTIPLADASVDYVNCSGVLHHTSHPELLLAELHRVLRPGGTGSIMVYNRESVWLHLYVAYMKQILEGLYDDLSVEEAFQRTTDGPDCPIARCYRPDEFAAMCREAGFEAEFAGAYAPRDEIEWLNAYGPAAVGDERLALEHREFLTGVEAHESGMLMRGDRGAGVGAVYSVRRPAD